MTVPRWVVGAVNSGLVVVAVIALVIGVVGFAWLTGDPIREENDQCIGGGHLTYGIVMLGVGVTSLLMAIASLVQALRGRRSWPFGVLGASLVVVAVLLVVYIPETAEINVGQC